MIGVNRILLDGTLCFQFTHRSNRKSRGSRILFDTSHDKQINMVHEDVGWNFI
jgi:hypothetical protein